MVHKLEIVKQYCNLDAKLLILEWNMSLDDNKTSEYPMVWLRDNCQCVSCFDPSALARSQLLRALNVDEAIADIQIDNVSGRVSITWSDGHRSPYEYEWLWTRTFRNAYWKARLVWHNLPVRTWSSADMAGKIPRLDFHQLLIDDSVLYEWITTLEEVGICLLKGAPLQPHQLQKIGDRIMGYLRATHYGTTFTVASKVQPSNLAYTSGELGLHCDSIYYNNVPGMQMLHCIKQIQTVGGDNIFSDGFHVARQLKDEYPDYYRLLTTTSVDYYDKGCDKLTFHTVSHHRTIQLDESGEVQQINLSNHSRDSFMVGLSPDQVRQFYVAMKTFNSLLYDPKNIVQMKLEEGDIICFHNFRVLHGRLAYTTVLDGERILEGSYLEWDDLRSRRRCLMADMMTKKKKVPTATLR